MQKFSNPDSTLPRSIPWWQIILPFAAVVLLNLIGSQIGGIYFWGVSLWSALSPMYLWLAIGAFVALSIPQVSVLMFDLTVRVVSLRRWLPVLVRRWAGWVALLLLFASVSWTFRSQNLAYGDGFSVFGPMARPLHESFTSLHEAIRPLTVVLYSLASEYLKANYWMDDLGAVSFISVVGGVVGFMGLVAVVRALADDAQGRVTIFLVAVAGSSTLLFLGHIEVYVWSTAAQLWNLVCALRYIRYRRGFVPLVLSSIVAVLFNGLLLPVLLATLVYAVVLHRTGRVAKVVARPFIFVFMLAMLSVAAGVTLWLTGIPYAVPVLATASSAYSLFCPEHLVDWINLVLFLSPAGVAVIAFTVVSRRLKVISPEGKLLLIAVASSIFSCFWIDPSLGAVRDWDLLSLFGFPLALLGGWMVTQVIVEDRGRKILVMQSLLSVLFVLAPLVFDNMKSEISINRIEAVTWQDMHYTAEYQKADRCIPWGMNLFKDCRRPDLAQGYFRRNVEADSLSHLGWYNLGVVDYSVGRFVEAQNNFVRALRLRPESPTYRQSVAAAMRANGNFDGADRLMRPLTAPTR